ncbi:MAG: ubiquitin-binding protein cue5 [Caeruleum heppii]|nr:MAG: ubiquitin-binding protein cue5 [Caeruleum heppii]
MAASTVVDSSWAVQVGLDGVNGIRQLTCSVIFELELVRPDRRSTNRQPQRSVFYSSYIACQTTYDPSHQTRMTGSKPEEDAVSPLDPPARDPESPTTARELDFDDESNEASTTRGNPTSTSSDPSSTTKHQKPSVTDEDGGPPKPPRPLSPQQQAENTLKEAFPSIDAAVVKAVLTASGGRVEPAFNALLGMSDPEAVKDSPPPAQPPRPARSPVSSHGPTTTPQNQLLADEQYARQLAEHYGGAMAQGERRGSARGGPPLRQQRETGLKPNELYEDDHSFLNDDLPVIKENFKKGFIETTSKFNQWVTDLKKKIDGDDDDENNYGHPASGSGSNTGASQQPYGIRQSGELHRRSADRDRYDADPHVLSDDFGGLELRDDDAPPRRPARPAANPDLFKPTPATPPSAARKVSFQDMPSGDIDALGRDAPKPSVGQAPSSGAKTSKWQPLSTIEPSPVADNDPFSLGDSEDEREAKTKDLKSEDSDRLKNAAAEAMAEDIGTGQKKGLEPQTLSGPAGTKDKVAEDKLTGKS